MNKKTCRLPRIYARMHQDKFCGRLSADGRIDNCGIMKTVTLDVRSPNETMADFASAWNSAKAAQSARISFATPELLWKVLTAKRWELLKVLCGAGPISIREAARRVDRDVKAVHGDVTALLLAGILDRSKDGGIEFPFEAIKVEFLLEAA
jgi:predicted transcriptional regulator